MGCAAGLIKYLVFLFNLIFFLSGLAFLILGIIYAMDFADAVDLPDEGGHFKIAPIAVIIIGSIILVISFFGCCGAIKENSCMLLTYSVILIIILLIQVGIGIFALVEVEDEEDLKKIVIEQIDKLFGKYKTDDKDDLSTQAINSMQTALKCCGTTGMGSWEIIIGDPITLPLSCCGGDVTTCTKGSPTVFKESCHDELFTFLRDNIKIIGIVLLALGATEVIAAVFAICLSRSIKRANGHY